MSGFANGAGANNGRATKAIISGWAVGPEMLWSSGSDQVQTVDPLLAVEKYLTGDSQESEIDPGPHSEVIVPWLRAAKEIFSDESGEPRVYDSVIAYSLGGILALLAVEAGLLKPRQLILLSSTLCFAGDPTNDPSTDLPVWPGATPASIKALSRSITREREKALRSFFATVIGVTTPDKRREDALANGAARYAEVALTWGLDILASIDLRPSGPNFVLPVMILHGTDDEVIPAAAAARGSHIMPNTTPLFVNGGSHDLCHLAPDLVPSLLFGEPHAEAG